MDLVSDFWDARPCLVAPIPELHQAADLLSDAADALLAADDALARDCLRKADIPALYAFATSIMGKVQQQVIRYRGSNEPRRLAKCSDRTPAASVVKAVYSRDGWYCRFCGVRVMNPLARKAMVAAFPEVICWSGPDRHRHAAFYALSATIDHIVPHARGGDSAPENLVTTCYPCNFGHGSFLIEEIGLIDPRTRPPTTDEWDGLSRVLRHPRGASAAGAAVARPAGATTKACILSEPEWFALLDRAEPGVSSRLLAFLKDCADVQISWSTCEFLVIRIEVNDAKVTLFGVEPNGDVHIPWSIGEHKVPFRDLAVRIAASVPDAIVYETRKTWKVTRTDRTALNVVELLDASASIRPALEAFSRALRNGGGDAPG